jgi:hypothetical protein
MTRADKAEMLTAAVLAVVIVALVCLVCGCGWWQGIDVKIRPGGHPDTAPKVDPVPKPQPPPDDWAPPWFRRPKPEPAPTKG